jgi:hypothetical protein
MSSPHVETCSRCGQPAELPAVHEGIVAGQVEEMQPLCMACLQLLASEPEPSCQMLESRRDCEPHRGTLLGLLGMTSVILAFFSLCGGIAGLFSFALGIAVWVMARQDLAKMDQGIMEREGESAAIFAKDYSQCAVLLSSLMLVMWGAFWIMDNNWLFGFHVLVDGFPDH